MPEEYIGPNTIILVHDGSYPITEGVLVEPVQENDVNRSLKLSSEVCMNLIGGTQSELLLELNGCLELNHALLDLRLVNHDADGHRSYSRPYNYLVSDPAALKVKLNKIGNIFNPGRYATFTIDTLLRTAASGR